MCQYALSYFPSDAGFANCNPASRENQMQIRTSLFASAIALVVGPFSAYAGEQIISADESPPLLLSDYELDKIVAGDTIFNNGTIGSVDISFDLYDLLHGQFGCATPSNCFLPNDVGSGTGTGNIVAIRDGG